MSRYFTIKPRADLWVGDYDDDPVSVSSFVPSVPEHIASDTGLLDVNGDRIMRAPRPIGFGKGDDW